MKLIEGMKLIKELQVKADDLRKKVGQYCADQVISRAIDEARLRRKERDNQN
jgi:hypothetical protein